jgi:NADPH-dependent 2,4-dienoyl-CoA reductase/sulfur reductase-like enzyme
MVYNFVKPTSVCTIQRKWQKFSGGARKVLDLNCCYLEESIEARHYKALVVVGGGVVSVAADRVGACCCCCCSVAASEEKRRETKE